MGVRMRNWLRRRISTIFEYVRIVGAAFFWYTFMGKKAAFLTMDWSIRNGERAMDSINDVFVEYQGIYKKILGSFYPAKNSTGFPERNLSVNLSKAYEKVAETKGQKSISWFELQFGERNNSHVDAVIINLSTNELLIVEAKRFSNPALKMKEILKDIERIHSLVAELKTEKRIKMDEIKRCYGVVLADVWTETDIKKQILESYKIGQRNPQDEGSFIKRNFPELKLSDLQYDVRDISEIENYYLLSFLWEILL